MRIKLTISYIGAGFCGWQSQTNGNAIQDKVEFALQQYFGGQFVRIFAAGRTDVGVNAVGQVVHFDIDRKVNTFKLCLGTNLNLPKEISVVNAQIVDDSFDARFSAVCKTYCYKLYMSPTRKPLFDVDRCQIYAPLDVDKMKAAAKWFVGTHDFAAFQKTGSNLKGTVRTINNLEIVEGDDDTVDILVNGNAFLYNMVRIVAGALVEVGKGKIQPSFFQEYFANSQPQKLKVKTLAAHGLTLEKVFY